MSRLTGLVDAVVADPVVAAALEQAREPAGTTLDLSAPGAIRPVLYAALAAAADRGGADRPVLAVTATFREAEELTEALRCLVDDPASVVYYPAWETLPHERLSPRSRHGRPAARGTAPAGASRTPRTRPPARSGSWSLRSAASCSRR